MNIFYYSRGCRLNMFGRTALVLVFFLELYYFLRLYGLNGRFDPHHSLNIASHYASDKAVRI